MFRRFLAAFITVFGVVVIGFAAPAVAAPPVVSPPVQAFTKVGSTVGQSSIQEVIYWRLQNPGSSGVDRYLLEQYSSTCGCWTTAYRGPNKNVTLSLQPGVLYQFRVTPFANNGERGATQSGDRFRPYQVNESGLSYYSTWKRVFASSAIGGAYYKSTSSNSYAEYCDIFAQFSLVAPKNAAGGTGQVYLNGRWTNVSFYSRASKARVVVFKQGFPTNKYLCFRLYANSASPVYIDAVQYNVIQ